ncbi:PhoD-like phosphatase N-terminal domain-containing protein, partial [Actinomadura adrarensis]
QFAYGVASGDPLPTSVLIWTRVTPTPQSVPPPRNPFQDPVVRPGRPAASPAAGQRGQACGMRSRRPPAKTSYRGRLSRWT